MAPRQGKTRGEGNVTDITSTIKTGSANARASALQDLIDFFKGLDRSTGQKPLKDKGYHEVFEALFQASLAEKKSYLSNRGPKNITSSRLTKCAEALRIAVTHGASKIKRQTARAVIDHITQTLPDKDQALFEPFASDYIKALVAVLGHPANVEGLAIQDGEGWSICVDFCVEAIINIVDIGDRDAGYFAASRASPAPGTGQTLSTPYSTGRSIASSAHRTAVHAHRSGLQSLVQCLLSLVLASNAPLLSRAKMITDAIVQVLQLRQLNLSALHQLAFATLNCVLSSCVGDDLSLGRMLTKELVPLLSHWWQPRALAYDEMLFSVRDEMLKTLYGLHLYIDSLISDPSGGTFMNDVEELLEGLWLEYSKRDERTRLQLDDITFSSINLPIDYFSTNLFGLRPCHQAAERRWAAIEVIALLEDIVARSSQHLERDEGEDEQPRKRRRTAADANRIHRKMLVNDGGMKLTTLQVIPFLLSATEQPLDGLFNMIEHLTPLIGDKHGSLSSWAMIACASCAVQKNAPDSSLATKWKQLWQLAVRSVSIPSTSRAACVLLHSILELRLVADHEMADDINNIVTVADISGPPILVDASLSLMHHLLHLRNSMLPSASQKTRSHIIRWVFSIWKPADPVYASLHSIHAPALDLVNLLRACCGMPKLILASPIRVFGSSISQSRKVFRETSGMTRYLLLLDERDTSETSRFGCGEGTSNDHALNLIDDAGSHYTTKLTLELFFPKIEELSQLFDLPTRRGEGLAQISTERLQSLFSCCISGAIFTPHFENVDSTISREFGPNLFHVLDKLLEMVLTSGRTQELVDLILSWVAPYTPSVDVSSLEAFCKSSPHLLRVFSSLSGFLSDLSLRQNSGQSSEMMEIDEDEFESQNSQRHTAANHFSMPRHEVAMNFSREAFNEDTKQRLHLLSAFRKDHKQIGLLPGDFVNQILALSHQDFLLCRAFLREIFSSDITINSDDALRFVEMIGEIIGMSEFSTCEVALCTCVDMLEGLAPVWLDDKGELSSMVGDLYTYLVNKSLPMNFLSPTAQVSFSGLLYRLLELNSGYATATSQTLPSCRSSLLSILSNGAILVKFAVGIRLQRIFELFVLNTHEAIFLDVLNSLPADPDSMEGIAFRMFVLADLACNCSTLLRRCVYHIFETPGKINSSAPYATHCLEKISRMRSLKSPRDLFKIFAPQLLYTWLDGDVLEDIPHAIFGFSSLDELLKVAQTEATALMMMRGQENEATALAERLHLTPVNMIQQGFSKILAYCIAYDISTKRKDQATGEARVRKLLGKDPYFESIYLHFADIIAIFFDSIDQEDPIEETFRKDANLSYAADIMDEIKRYGHSPVELPANQQPMFRAKYLTREIAHLCSRTEYEMPTLWTPPLVVSVARKLLNTVHLALGPQHACSVIRKVRILICLAGQQATMSYPLEMLLHSVRPFIRDVECADDALGITRYLIEKGSPHLTQMPSFLAGYAISALASLRMFLESSQASTTQESQFRATMSKAQQFHTWFAKYLAQYESPAFIDEVQRSSFRSITLSASHIRSSGNAEKGTHESNLLLEILKDGERGDQLLNDSARNLVLGMLCGDFNGPVSTRNDIIELDEDALLHGTVVWKSCRAQNLSKEYLTWAGRVVGRAFASSGDVHTDLLRESLLTRYRKITAGDGGSEQGLLNLLEALTKEDDSFTAGLAESALRNIVTDAAGQENNDLHVACQRSLSETLCVSSDWVKYRTPPSDYFELSPGELQAYAAGHIEQTSWARDLGVYLAQSLEEDVILSVLSPILTEVKGFAEEALPFIVHLVLLLQLDKHQTVKRDLSDAIKRWIKSKAPSAKDNIKLLINTILYLRNQPMPNETSIIDRLHWLDIDFSAASAAATKCGMFKVALLFTELAFSESSRAPRRSSAIRDMEDSAEILLGIFENIDDPDAYYGLNHVSSLENVIARLEYENDGAKLLAFRGAQYDSHIRRRDYASEGDGKSLVHALSSLGLFGISHALLQSQQALEQNSSSLDTTFTTARRLEMWNLPVPPASENHSVTEYKTYQSFHKAVDIMSARKAVHDGLASTISHLTKESLNAPNLRNQLATLAVLTELDDVLSVSGPLELNSLLSKFEQRSKWMMSGRYADISQVLSCRETTLSMFTQKDLLRNSCKVTWAQSRLVEIRSMLLSSSIYRVHNATQESLNLSTSLTDLIESSEEAGLYVDAAINIEVANSLWDHGEMIPSIRMLQNIDKESILKKQSVPVSRSDLLSKAGYQVSVAKLESPDNIQKKYLEPALKDLKGKIEGKDAGRVFHQFALFCDQELQNPDGLAHLARLQTIKQKKSDEVAQLRNMIAKEHNTQQKHKYNNHLGKARQVLDLDQAELSRTERLRSEFVKLSLENYLLSLAASDEHNNDALRFTALWLEHSDEDATNEVVRKHLERVPTRKLAPLMNQLTSRLQDQSNMFQKLLINLVLRICIDHPYHGMYQIWSGVKSRANKDDDVAVLRQKATEKVSQQIIKNPSRALIWTAIDRTSRYYHQLAMERDPNKYKAGHKSAIKDSTAGQNLAASLTKYQIPPPTMQIELSSDRDYSNVPTMMKLEPIMSIASGVSAPKIITAVGSNGQRFRQLVKGGNDDLRQDAIMEQVFAAVSEVFKLHRTTRQRNLGIRTYKVLPLTSASGLIEFVSDTIPLHEYLMPAHERYYPKDLKGSQCRKEISAVQSKPLETRISTYRKVTDKFHPVMKYFFMENFPDPDEWYVKRLAYTRSTAAISMLGHVLGLGDRHGHNILLDTKNGEVVHIDLGVAFEMGRVLPVPELVPFRMTRDIVDGMGITKTEGVFRRCCEFALDAMREETYSIMTILDVLRYDPLYTWSISPVRMAKLQDARRTDEGGVGDEHTEIESKKAVNEPSEADRALEVVQKKLSKTLSVTATVNDLINQATDEKHLAVLYSGWAAYA